MQANHGSTGKTYKQSGMLPISAQERAGQMAMRNTDPTKRQRGVGVGQAKQMGFGSEKVGSAGTAGKGLGQGREAGSTPGGPSAKVGAANSN
jgi:hypothetical protein